MTIKSELIPRPVTILDVKQESLDIMTFKLDERADYRPGQFYQISVLGVGEAPISISSYSREHMTISVRIVGNVTRALADKKKGDVIHIRGPYGNGYAMEEYNGKNLILIGAGCGVAPLKGIIDYLRAHHEDFGEIHLFLGFHSPDDVIFQKEMEDWHHQFNVSLVVSSTPGESCYTGAMGHVTDELLKLKLTDVKNSVVLMCGPPRMMKDSISILQEKGMTDDQFYLSTERLMYCAIGQCCHCMIKGKFVCTDGPVFRYSELAESTDA